MSETSDERSGMTVPGPRRDPFLAPRLNAEQLVLLHLRVCGRGETPSSVLSRKDSCGPGQIIARLRVARHNPIDPVISCRASMSLAPVTGTGPPQTAETAVTVRTSPPAGANVASSRLSCHGTCPHMPSRAVINLGRQSAASGYRRLRARGNAPGLLRLDAQINRSGTAGAAVPNAQSKRLPSRLIRRPGPTRGHMGLRPAAARNNRQPSRGRCSAPAAHRPGAALAERFVSQCPGSNGSGDFCGCRARRCRSSRVRRIGGE